MPISTPIPPVGATATVQEPVTPAAPKQTLDSEVFLELLVTQLRNQDPSSPMDTTQMIAQTTQLASMEQLTTLARLTEESFSLQMRSAAADLLGREVSYTDADGATHTGIASAVSYADQVPTVTVGTERVTLDTISGVTTTTDA
jgi:flagellar basal-body rod modification protein FlgD